MFTLRSKWLNHYLGAASLLHHLLGHPAPSAPVSPPEPQTLISLLQDVVQKKYVPGKYFRSGQPAQNPQFQLEAPAVDPEENYLMITVNAHSAVSTHLSGVYSGGAIFEDPAWALLGALALAQTGLKRPLAISRAVDNTTLWRNLGRAARAVTAGEYRAEDFFSRAEPFENNKPSFSLTPVKGSSIQFFRENGQRTIPAFERMLFFQLYTPF